MGICGLVPTILALGMHALWSLKFQASGVASRSFHTEIINTAMQLEP